MLLLLVSLFVFTIPCAQRAASNDSTSFFFLSSLVHRVPFFRVSGSFYCAFQRRVVSVLCPTISPAISARPTSGLDWIIRAVTEIVIRFFFSPLLDDCCSNEGHFHRVNRFFFTEFFFTDSFSAFGVGIRRCCRNFHFVTRVNCVVFFVFLLFLMLAPSFERVTGFLPSFPFSVRVVFTVYPGT